jgi:hypothetical protein
MKTPYLLSNDSTSGTELVVATSNIPFADFDQ